MTACPKTQRLVDKAYRKSAQHRHCMVRHPETGDFCSIKGVALAHIRLNNAGTGLKPPDDESLFLCTFHHDEFDRRRGTIDATISAMAWLVRNVYIPERKAAYRKYKMGTGR